MIGAILIAASMCLQGGEQVDLSQYLAKVPEEIRLQVTLRPDTGSLIVYSPGYEDRPVLFNRDNLTGSVPIAEPVICVKAMGGPFEFDIKVLSGDDE